LSVKIKKIYAFQSLIALYAMDYYFNAIHTDLTDKNLLITDKYEDETDINDDECDIYNVILNGDINTYYIPHTKSKIIVWDWGRASIYQNEDDYTKINHNRRGCINNHYKDIYVNILNLNGWNVNWDYEYFNGHHNLNIPPNVEKYKEDFVNYFSLFDVFKNKSPNLKIKDTYTFLSTNKIKKLNDKYINSFIFDRPYNKTEEKILRKTIKDMHTLKEKNIQKQNKQFYVEIDKENRQTAGSITETISDFTETHFEPIISKPYYPNTIIEEKDLVYMQNITTDYNNYNLNKININGHPVKISSSSFLPMFINKPYANIGEEIEMFSKVAEQLFKNLNIPKLFNFKNLGEEEKIENEYLQKYLKYKSKYLTLKKNI
jgi:hypothetical protein